MSKVSTRTEYEQLEFQRKNPHLFTTMTQSVNPDGSITTFEQVTRGLKHTTDKAQEAHTKVFGGEHPVYCMRPVMGVSEHQICQIIEHCKKDMDRCLTSFVKNYSQIQAAAKQGVKL